MSTSFKYTDISVIDNDFEPIKSSKITTCLLKNNRNDIIRTIDFFNSGEKFLYIHGFMGTGKRQFVNYVCEYLSKDVIKLEYYCKEATVCDDILLSFTDTLEKLPGSKPFRLNAKITTLSVKFQKLIEFLKKPLLIILHSMDNISGEDLEHVSDTFSKVLKDANVKIIVTTCALKPGLMGSIEEDKTIFLKALSKEVFNEYVLSNNVSASDRQLEDFYALTKGYYFYTALSLKIIQAMQLTLVEFMQKIKNADVTFDKYIGECYINLIPAAIRNFYWFLRAIRHGISMNAMAILEIYDEFSIQYLINNLIAFQSDDTLYLNDYFSNRIEMMLPLNTEIKLHKYIIGIYEQQLKENLATRAIFISRQALRQEIEYHKNMISDLENKDPASRRQIIQEEVKQDEPQITDKSDNASDEDKSISKMVEEAYKLADDNVTGAIEKLKAILDNNEVNLNTLVDIRLHLAKLYKTIEDYSSAMHYYELVEAYYKNNKEFINLNYLYYEMTDLYYKMYKSERAIQTIKNVIYSVDTPQSLMVSACTLLGNIYSDMNSPENAFSYYQKAIDSTEENVSDSVLSELYFKFALANDDKGDINTAFEYYNKCISISENNNYLASAYSNLAACYYENGNTDDALDCYNKAYNIEKSLNNYDGIYYTSSHIAAILNERDDSNTLKYLKEAKQSADFLNESFYMIEASIALGDYYYNDPQKAKEALQEYLSALRTADSSIEDIDVSNIAKRIEDMKLRMDSKDFEEILKKYE